MKNKKEVVFILVLLVIIFLFVYKNLDSKEKACIEKRCFAVDVAKTPIEITSGLSGRDSIQKNQGMIFVFNGEESPGFWMKGMKFPLDIIWIDKNMKVIGIEKNINPCNSDSCPLYYPKENIKYVLEVNAGLSDIYGFKERDSVYLSF